MPAVAAKPLRLPPIEAPRFEVPYRVPPGWADPQALINNWNRQALVDRWLRDVGENWASRTIRGYYLEQAAVSRVVPRRGFLVQPPKIPPILQPVPPILAPPRLATIARTRSLWTLRLGSTGFIGAAISVFVQAAQSVFKGPPPTDRFRRALASAGGDYLGSGSKDLIARGARSLASSPLLAGPIVAGAPQPNIRVDARGFGQALKKYWETVGGDLGEILRTQTRLVSERCIDLTPPFSGKRLSRMLGAEYGRTTAKGIGEARVKRDIERVFVPVNQLILWRTMQEFRNAVDRRDQEEIKRLLGPKFHFVNITPTPSPSLHQTQRNRRGNVRNKPQQQLILEPGNVQKYVKERQKWVGFAKSGWGEAARKFGAKLPAWVARHNGPGFAYDLTGEERMSTRIGNQVGYIQAKGRDLRIIELAVTAQEKAMISNIKRILRERAKI